MTVLTVNTSAASPQADAIVKAQVFAERCACGLAAALDRQFTLDESLDGQTYSTNASDQGWLVRPERASIRETACLSVKEATKSMTARPRARAWTSSLP